MTLRWKCETQGCYKNSLPDWGFLRGVFPRGIEPTDIDGEVELNGHFLRLEWKKRGALIPVGQRLALVRRTQNETDTVFVIYGEQGEAVEMQIIFRGVMKKKIEATADDVRARCKAWADWAIERPACLEPTSQSS